MEGGYALAFATGLLGSLGHCVGMCGPLMGALTLRDRCSAGRVRALPQALYHAGRITTYGIIGAAMGFTGSFVQTAGRIAGLQLSVMLLAGILMVLMGLGIAGLLPVASRLEGSNAPVLRAAARVLGGASDARFFLLGLLLGLLPCGLSYTAFIAAAGTASPVDGLLLLLCFGAGTVPALALFGAAAAHLGSRLRGRIQQAGGLVVVLLGILFIIKGIRSYAAM